MKTPLECIRTDIFKLKQAEFAVIAGTSQTLVSRWENGVTEPTREHMENIRKAAIERGIQWDDSWFFRVPDSVEQGCKEASPFTEAAQ